MPRLTEWFARAGLNVPGDALPQDIEVSGFQADSRKLRPGEAFVAIAGTALDGWDYAAEAVARGAVAVLGEAAQGQKQAQAQAQDKRASLPVPVIALDNIRRAWALLCAAMYPQQPDRLVAVTGTNGKTSVAEFYRQLWAREGAQAASIGTLGLLRSDASADPHWQSGQTTPPPDMLHAALQQLAQDGVTHVAIEASSHGLDQYRLDGVRFGAAAFTNLSQDHLDYHHTMEAYFHAKARLFSDFGATNLINADDAYGRRLLAMHPDALSYGEGGAWLRLIQYEARATGLHFVLEHDQRRAALDVALYGPFQLYNLMAAGGLALASGMAWEALLRHLPHLHGVRGRMEHVATHPCGAPVFVDYAHTPDALKHLLISLRAHTQRKLHVVFGCGGDRDTTKRAPMGAIATAYADRVIVTDDNPRHEDPAAIRAQVLSQAGGAHAIAPRDAAIMEGLRGLQAGDVLVVAGKGHETHQIIGSEKQEFNDADRIREALGAL